MISCRPWTGRATGLAAAIACAATAAADVTDLRQESGLAVFSDNMGTTVVSPHAGAAAVVPADLEIEINWTADVISSASVDVVTAGTPQIHETRHAFTLAGRRPLVLPSIDLSGGYTYSFERDYISHAAQIGAARTSQDKNTELRLDYALSYNQIGVRGEPRAQWRTSWIHTLDLTLSQTINQRSVADINLTGIVGQGFQASPYRRVPILLGDDLVSAIWLAESVPDRRLRLGITPRYRRALGRRWIASAAYRLYLDSWGVLSHTTSLDGVLIVNDSLSLRFHQRASYQGPADFYRASYSEELEYRSRDRRLSRHLSGVAGALLLWELGPIATVDSVDLHLGADVLGWRYDEFLAPALSPTSDATFEPVGWVRAFLVIVGLEATL